VCFFHLKLFFSLKTQIYPGGFAGGPLTAKEYKERLVTSEGTQSVTLPRANYTIRYAYVSQRGYYPDSLDKANQVSVFVIGFFCWIFVA
jgi:hypothetical protein